MLLFPSNGRAITSQILLGSEVSLDLNKLCAIWPIIRANVAPIIYTIPLKFWFISESINIKKVNRIVDRVPKICKILNNIIEINNDILNNLIFYEIIFKNIFDNIKISNNLECLEDQLKNDKTNDFNKQICVFFINCYLNDIVNDELIYTSIIDLHNNLLQEIKKPDNKVMSEAVVEFLNLLLTEIIDKTIYKAIDKDNSISRRIISIACLKRDSYLSITNKIIFKFKDIQDKIK